MSKMIDFVGNIDSINIKNGAMTITCVLDSEYLDAEQVHDLIQLCPSSRVDIKIEKHGVY